MIQKWFQDAKLGIFIHWGIYAVKGITESWSFATGEISYDDYMSQLDGFIAENYDPQKWAALLKQTGAKYAVLTTKHHDGVALFDSKYSDLNVVKNTPAKRDLVKPYCKALREQGLKVGLYYTNTDWSNLDHMSVVLKKPIEEILKIRKVKTNFAKIWRDLASIEADMDIVPTEQQMNAWNRFIEFYRNQMNEVLTNYGDIDLIWFDVMLQKKGFDWGCKKTHEMISSINPHTIINSRLLGYGDYETPEQYIPIAPLNGEWEFCTTFNNSWGYQPQDKNYKSTRQIVRMFCECISKGGNMLISVGPDAKGEIPLETEKAMLALGKWVSRYEEAIFPTKRGIDPAYFLGGSTLSDDEKTLYLFAYDIQDKNIMLNGIRSKISKITALKTNTALSYTIYGGAEWINMPGCIWIDIPETAIDDVCTVIKIEFNEPIDLVEINNTTNSAGEI